MTASLCKCIYTGLVNCLQLYQLPNIQMQKTGAGAASQSDTALPASDLGRWGDRFAEYDYPQ